MDTAGAIEAVYRSDWGRIVATLIRLTGDFDLAEEAAQEAFTAALQQWPSAGLPNSPSAWIIQTARHKAIDRIRRSRLFAEQIETQLAQAISPAEEPDYAAAIPDARLHLIFTCCHPALAPEAQVALTLRTLCGLETDEIARAFLVPPATMAQRLVRAQRKIRDNDNANNNTNTNTNNKEHHDRLAAFLELLPVRVIAHLRPPQAQSEEETHNLFRRWISTVQKRHGLTVGYVVGKERWPIRHIHVVRPPRLLSRGPLAPRQPAASPPNCATA